MPGRRGEYNAVVIGAGTAGLVTAAGLAGLGAKVALIERRKMGGDCLNYGCVPSKALIETTRRIHAIRHGERYGLRPMEPSFEFGEVFDRMRQRRAAIAPNDSRERFESLGVDVILGEARFASPHEVVIDEGRRLTAEHFVIATGSRAAVPNVDWLATTPYYTNETIFDELREKPESLAILGGGPIGCELAQVFARLGVRVHLMQKNARLLPKEDEDVSPVVERALRDDGVDVGCNAELTDVREIDGTVQLSFGDWKIEASALLVAIGRELPAESLGLTEAGVHYGERRISVNAYLQTRQPHIYACGDCTGDLLFTHVADAQARVVVRNITMPYWKQKWDASVVPWCTYTQPEVATVGMNERAAAKAGIACDAWKLPMRDLDRAVVADETDGFTKVLTARGSDRIVGATIVGAHAGELIHEFALAMKHRVGLSSLSSLIHAYPTFSEIARKSGDAYQRSRLTPRLRSVLSWWFARRRLGGRTT